MRWRMLVAVAAINWSSASVGPTAAAEAQLRIMGQDKSYVVRTDEGEVTITRRLTRCAMNKGWLQPMVPVAGVTPVGEIEVLKGLNDPNTRVVDMREVEWFAEETIPAAHHIPYTEVASRLDELGCKMSGSGWNCTDAKWIIAFCNGPVCPQSPTAIRAMHREGFPMDKVMYYRGGMQSWKALGLTTVEGDF
ncbi:MAG: rhodanese-like domain-containing protein [Hyphomicrobiaceae bacterium]